MYINKKSRKRLLRLRRFILRLVSTLETLSFNIRNTLFLYKKQSVSKVETKTKDNGSFLGVLTIPRFFENNFISFHIILSDISYGVK